VALEGARRDIFDVFDDIARVHGTALEAARTPERADADRRRLLKWAIADPLVRQYAALNVGRTHGSVPLTVPWMALAEQRVNVALLAGDVPLVVIDGHTDEPQTIKRVRLAVQLRVAQTYLWSKTCFGVIKTCPLPSHVVDRELLPFPITYHTTEVAYDVVFTNPERFAGVTFPAEPCIDWTLIGDVPGQHGCSIAQNVSGWAESDTPRAIVVSGLHFGRTYPDDFPPHEREALRVVLSMFAFLRSPFTEVTQRLLPRQLRRHGELTPEDAKATVAVVELRQAAREAVEAYNAESPAWKHRWWVCGHFRRQWQPSTQAHEVIWIAPHLKGPEGLPMLEKVHAVRR
jgi:hypothetical protein